MSHQTEPPADYLLDKCWECQIEQTKAERDFSEQRRKWLSQFVSATVRSAGVWGLASRGPGNVAVTNIETERVESKGKFGVEQIFYSATVKRAHLPAAPVRQRAAVRGTDQCGSRRWSWDRGWRCEAWEMSLSRTRGSWPHSRSSGWARRHRCPRTCAENKSNDLDWLTTPSTSTTTKIKVTYNHKIHSTSFY